MKKFFLIITALSVLYSCEKDDSEPIEENIGQNENIETDDDIETYELPWSTEFINYENISDCVSSHSSGYKLYYKDSLLIEDCVDFGGISITDSLLVNDSILHLFFVGNDGSYDLITRDGGLSWEKFLTGPPELSKIHVVNTDLVYFVTRNSNDLYFTGVGESNLSLYKDTLTSGTHYIIDSGTNITDLDSTVIEINDNVEFIIKFQ